VRSRIVATFVAAGLLASPIARAEDPCAADAKKFCGEVEVGAGRVQQCMRQHEAELSPACRAKQAAADAKFRAIVAEFGADCRADVDRVCAKVKPGRGRVVACLLRQQDDLSSRCRAHTDRFQEGAEKINAVRAACKADVERVCVGVPNQAGPLVECLRANREGLSEECRTADPELGANAAELVDAVESLGSMERAEEAQQILQGVDSIAFSRSQVLFQVDSYQGFAGAANANRFLFNPQLVFGDRNDFSIQLKAPLYAVYPYAPGVSAQTGLGAVTTAFAWGFQGSARVHQFLSLGLQWISPMEPPVGSGWAVTPGYAISVGVTRFLSLTAQVAWVRSFESRGYPELNVLVADPVIVVALPGRAFGVLDTKLGWNLVDHSFLPVMKGVVGVYINRQKSLAISGWYQRALSGDAEAQIFKFGVGVGLAYFFDW
jgi:hypothetical protein